MHGDYVGFRIRVWGSGFTGLRSQGVGSPIFSGLGHVAGARPEELRSHTSPTLNPRLETAEPDTLGGASLGCDSTSQFRLIILN